MSDYIARHKLPYFIQRGIDNTLSLDVYDLAGTQQTPSAVTIQVLRGATDVVASGTSATVAAPSTYTLTSATIGTDTAFADDWLVKWTPTLDGTAIPLAPVPAYLCRTIYRPVITDTDLTDIHSELADIIEALDDTSYQKQREHANVVVQTNLIAQGRRPHLIFDAWQVRLCHIYLTLHLIYNDFYSTIGDSKYARLRDYYWNPNDNSGLYAKTWETLEFRYDGNESGTMDANERGSVNSHPILSITAGNGPGRYSFSGGSKR